MTDLLAETQNRTFVITFNRMDKHNAFDDNFLQHLYELLHQAINDTTVKAIVLKANGKHFSAGADLGWMQRMANFSEQENLNDALVLADVMYTLYQSPKPTIAVVQGSALGGGAGLVAACDIAIAAPSARFCFSEVKLGLIPAVISPYVIKAIGERAAKWLFMSAEMFDAQRAQELSLIQHIVNESELASFALDYANKLTQLAPQAMLDCKHLVQQVQGRKISRELIQETATLIAKKRVSQEAQIGLKAFLAKETPNWN